MYPTLTLNNPHYADELVLIPTLHRTSLYNFSNPICIPLNNTPHEVERSKLHLFRLTTALTPRKFTHVGYNKLLNIFTSPRTNDYSIDFYDHNIIRPNQDQFLDKYKFSNAQLTENFFIRTPYIFTLSSLDKKHDHIISKALIDIQAYESVYDKFQDFSLAFHFLTPRERDLHCSPDIMLRTNKRTLTHIIDSFKIILLYTHLYDNPTIVFSVLFRSKFHNFS